MVRKKSFYKNLLIITPGIRFNSGKSAQRRSNENYDT